MKLRAQVFFDDILTKWTRPMTRINPPRQVSKTNNNTDMVNYAVILTKDSTPYDLNKNIRPKSSLKRNLTIFYDINATKHFPNILS